MDASDETGKGEGDSAVTLPEILPGELLSSWLIRCSFAHGSDPLGWTYGFWGDWRAWTVDMDRTLPPERTAALSRFSGVPESRIREATLEPDVRRVLGGGLPGLRKAWLWISPLGTRNRTRTGGLHFCPLCLDGETPHMRKSRRLTWNASCGKHNVLLELRCPECRQPFSPHLADWLHPDFRICVRCGFDLRRVPVETADSRLLLLKRRLDAAPAGAETTELFALARDLAVLLRNAARRPKIFSGLAEAAEIEVDDRTASGGKPRGSFDAAPARERAPFLAGALTLSALSLEELVKVLASTGLTRGSLRHLCPLSSRKMSEALPLLGGKEVKGRKMRPRQSGEKAFPVLPRSREEVEAMMAELEKYL